MNKKTLGIVLAGFCAFLQLYSTQPLLPLLAQIFHADKVTVSLTVAMAGFGVAVAAPFAGLLADRIGRKRVIVWSAFLLALTSLATASSPNLHTLIVWRFLQGVFTPGVFSVTVAYINDEWSSAGVGKAISNYVSGTVLGGFSCRFISGLVASHFDWRWVFVVLGLLNLVAATAVMFCLPADTHTKVESRSGWARAAWAHLRNPQLLATYSVGFCVLFSLVSVFTYATFYLAEPPFRLLPAALGSIFLVYLVGAAVNPLAGRAIDHYGQRAVVAVGMGIGVAGGALTLVHSLWLVALGLTICSSGVFASQSAASSYVGLAASEHRALAVGLYASFYYTGGSAGAAIPSYFWNLGGWPACVAFIALVQLITVAIAWFYWPKDRPQQSQSFISAPELD